MNHSGSLDATKLRLLQTVGRGRPWFSLDEWRRCRQCGQMIAGRQIWIDRDRYGISRLRCPTPGCPATWAEWGDHPEAPEADWCDWVQLLDTLGDANAGWRRAIRRIRPLGQRRG